MLQKYKLHINKGQFFHITELMYLVIIKTLQLLRLCFQFCFIEALHVKVYWMEGTSWQHTILKNAFVEFYEQETVWMQYKLDIQVKLYTCSYKMSWMCKTLCLLWEISGIQAIGINYEKCNFSSIEWSLQEHQSAPGQQPSVESSPKKLIHHTMNNKSFKNWAYAMYA